MRAERLDLAGGNEHLLTRRVADAVWYDSTARARPRVEVHELKVSTCDLRAELRRPEKALIWLQVAHRFWLTVPDMRILANLTLPEEWGVLVLPYGKSPNVVREAPLLEPAVVQRGPTRVNYWTVAAAGKTSNDGLLKHEWRHRYFPRPAAVRAHRERMQAAHKRAPTGL